MIGNDATFQFVRADHYLHLLALWGAGVSAWYYHGFLWGIAAVAALWVTISTTNLLAMSAGSLWVLRANRWLWIIVAYALILIA